LAGVGCSALADHLRTATWPSKFWPHLPKKYDGTSNPSEFLQVYVTTITAAGGDTAVMATYFHVALSGPARTWLMNLTLGSIYSWEELYTRFTANFASTYQQHGVEAHLHAVRQEPGETLRAFISRFTKVRDTIPRISDASIITAFRQGVRDEKMLEKLATHDVETVTTLFALADKCARAAEGRAWHSAPQTRVAQTGGSGAVAQDGKKKKKKNHNHEKPSSAAPIVTTATGGRSERNKRPRPQGGNSGTCPVKSIEDTICFFENYRNEGFASSLITAKEIAFELGLQPSFPVKRRATRKKHYDETSNEEENLEAQKAFEVNYFLVMVDIATSSLKSRFEELQSFKGIFGFLMTSTTLKSLETIELRDHCTKFASTLSFDGSCDVDLNDLISELSVLRLTLSDKPMSPMEIFEHVREVDCYPNISIAYRILFTVPATVASAERSFSKLKLLMNYLRSKMYQERLNGLAILCIEKILLDEVDIDTIINDFTSKHVRRKF
jgi:hypothetical protein